MASSAAAFVRHDFLSHASYRVQMVLSIAGLVAMTIPALFIARALQPTMADAISRQGDQYFAFLIVGFAAQRLISGALGALPSAIGSGIRTGTLEALFATPAPVKRLVGGMMGYRILWALFEAVLLIGAGWLLGARLVPGQILTGLMIMAGIVLAYVPFGLIGAAGVLAFRTSGPLFSVVVMASALLGGVYYPTHVIPSWIESLSAFIPLTYGLRALRGTVLEGLPLGAVANDLLVLLGFIVVLGGVAVILFAQALRYARRSGSLAQY